MNYLMLLTAEYGSTIHADDKNFMTISLSQWTDRDFDIDALEKLCQSTRKSGEILLELWNTNRAALVSLSAAAEDSAGDFDKLEENLQDRVIKCLYQYGKSVESSDPDHISLLKQSLSEHDVKCATLFEDLRKVSGNMSQVSRELVSVRQSKLEADEALLTAITSKTDLEKRFTPSAVGGSAASGSSSTSATTHHQKSPTKGAPQLSSSAMDILKKCDERIRQAQQAQLECGRKLTDLRESLDELSKTVHPERETLLLSIEQLEKEKISCISVTSSELYGLHLVLAKSVVDYLLCDGCGDASPKNSALNTSLVSSLANTSIYSFEESMNGYGWVDTIHRIPPSNRQLYEMQNVAEGLSILAKNQKYGADYAETQIDLMQKDIARLRDEISELQEGKGDYVTALLKSLGKAQGIDNDAGEFSSGKPERALTSNPYAIRYSLCLPLKTEYVFGSTGFWCSFSTEEAQESWKQVLDDPETFDHRDASGVVSPGNLHSSCSPWDFVVYEQVLLGYYDISTRFATQLTFSQWNKLKSVVHMCRLKFRIPTPLHETLVEFTLPDKLLATVTTTISPLDIRFRICRLLAVPSPKPGDSKKLNLYHDWVARQLQCLRFAVACLAKEDASNWTQQKVRPVVDAIDPGTEMEQPLFDLLELLTEYVDKRTTAVSAVVLMPRGLLFNLVDRLWTLCVSLDEENGLHADTPLMASFVSNFLTKREFPHHSALLGLALWKQITYKTDSSNNPSGISGALAKQVASILQPGDKFLKKIAGDLFWWPNSENQQLTADPARITAIDLAYLRTKTCKSRELIVSTLCDYRSVLEPQALESTISIFQHSIARMNPPTLVQQLLCPSETDYNLFLTCMCEFFIFESAKSVCDRLIDTHKHLDSVTVARAHSNDESRGIWISEVTSAIWKVVFEYSCEILVYGKIWKKFGLDAKHAYIWSSSLQTRIRSIVELINRDDDLWLTERVPPNGQELLALLQIWERVTSDSSLTELIKPKITRSLKVHLEKIERDSIPSCMHLLAGANSWAATRPPQILHSTKCVDLWTTVFTTIQACIDGASAQLSITTCVELIMRASEKYCDNAKEGFTSNIALSHPLQVKARRCVNRLIRSVDDETELPESYKSKKKKKQKNFRKDVSTGSAEEESDAGGFGGSHATGGTTTASTPNVANQIGDIHLLTSSEYINQTSKLHSHDATALMVRLHDMAFGVTELDKVREQLRESFNKESEKLSRLYRANQRAIVIGETSSSVANSTIPSLPLKTTQLLENQIEKGINICKTTLSSTGEFIVQYLAANMVYIDFKEDLFERLYMPGLRDYPLSRIIKKFESDKLTSFCLMAPAAWKLALCRAIVANFVYAWVYVVADMATRGRVFKESDTFVINSDLTSLHNLSDLLGLTTDPDTQELLKMVGCFPVYISGSTATEFKTVCEKSLAEPFEKTSKFAPSNMLNIVTSSSYGRKPGK